MGRLLLLIALIAITIYLVKRIYLPGSQNQKTSKGNPEDPQLMKKCEVCDLHIPSERAIRNDAGHFFCSEEHRKSFEDR